MVAGAALFVIGGALSALGIAVGGLGKLFSVVIGAIGLVGSLLGAILSSLGLVLAGVVGLGTYLVYSTDVGSQALSWLGKKFEDLKKLLPNPSVQSALCWPGETLVCCQNFLANAQDGMAQRNQHTESLVDRL
ncbi:hypothetical protein N9C08_01685 [Rubripirellula sp.]|jgi:hypothetical protein|nr:hypothetical protein [Rubripirellula sp.]